MWIQCHSRFALWIAPLIGSRATGSGEDAARQRRVMTVSAVRALTHFLLDVLYFLTGEGSWRLRPHEEIVIEAAIDILPRRSQALLRSQLKETMFIQRSHKQISRPRFYSGLYRPDRRALEDADYADTIIDVQLDVEGIHETAQVEFFRGRVDSIQFKRPAAHYAGKKLTVLGARRGTLARSHAAAIDRREHGTER